MGGKINNIAKPLRLNLGKTHREPVLRGSQRHQWPCPSSSNFGHPAHRGGHLSWYCSYETGSSLVDGVGAPLACLGAGLWRLHAVTDTCSDRMLQSLCYLRLCLKIGLPTLGWNSVVLYLILKNSSELVFCVCTLTWALQCTCSVSARFSEARISASASLPHLPLDKIFLR